MTLIWEWEYRNTDSKVVWDLYKMLIENNVEVFDPAEPDGKALIVAIASGVNSYDSLPQLTFSP